MAKEKDKVFKQVYDGIEEYDNDLPRWWVYLFYGTIVFSVVYVIYYHLGGPGLGQEQLLAIDMKALNEAKAASVAQQQGAGPKRDLLALTSDAAALAKGKEVYVGKCAACHGAEGQGLIGPNLVDKYWIHGGTLDAIRHTIEAGVVTKGMLAWKGVIPDTEIDAVTAYIWSIRNTTPANPKEPQGELVAQ